MQKEKLSDERIISWAKAEAEFLTEEVKKHPFCYIEFTVRESLNELTLYIREPNIHEGLRHASHIRLDGDLDQERLFSRVFINSLLFEHGFQFNSLHNEKEHHHPVLRLSLKPKE